MTTQTQPDCLRGLDCCVPLANIASDDGVSFICIGLNAPSVRTVPADRFTKCWKNDVVDERGHWDKRDLLDTASVIAQSLSIDENISIGEDLDEIGMQTTSFV